VTKEYPIFDISDQNIDEYEQMGTKKKFWYTDSQTGKEYLFKSVNTEDNNSNPITRKGEDWAEKIACGVAELLNIPHANYDLAYHKGERGVRSEKFTNSGDNMFFGNELIEHVASKINIPLEHGQHSQKVERVVAILERIVVNPPIGWEPSQGIKTALDVFIGYILLDVLISNQDRHNENWAMITNGGNKYLAPSFDHAASLGRSETIEKMRERLTTKDIGHQIHTYVCRSNSHFYFDNKKLKILDAFLMFGLHAKAAILEWLTKLETIEDRDLFMIIDRVPDSIMGTIEKAFCLSILIANRARILLYKQVIINKYT
jgi:hypothetical protein